MAQSDDGYADYEALLHDVDDTFARIHKRWAAEMQCGAGCSDCCRARLSVTHLERAYLKRRLENVPPATRRSIVERARQEGREYCPALDADGCCEIYSSRPAICRSFGVPLFHASAEPVTRPAVVDVCDKNFTAHTPRALQLLPRQDLLDQTAVNRRIEALNRAYCAVHGHDPDERILLSEALCISSAPEE